MPIDAAQRRASSKSSAPQHDFAWRPRVGAYIFIVTPTTSKPRSAKRAAATAESTPPLIAATTRTFTDIQATLQDNPATAQTQSACLGSGMSFALPAKRGI